MKDERDTQKALSKRLKELEALKLVKREVEQEPLRVYYSLTTEGRAVKNAIQILISVINLIDSEHKDAFLCYCTVQTRHESCALTMW